MKKSYIAALLAVGLSISAFAADIVPQNQQGVQTEPRYAGSKTCLITVSTGTNPVLCATGAGIILQVIESSPSVANYLALRDSATANVTSSSLTVLTGSALSGTFIYPRFNNGLSANVIAALTSPQAFTIIYAQPK